MENLKIRQGETLSIDIKSDDDTAQTARLVARKGTETPVIDETVSFGAVGDDWIASFSIDTVAIVPDDYSYMITIVYEDDSIKKLPEADECESECDLPILTVCTALDLGVS